MLEWLNEIGFNLTDNVLVSNILSIGQTFILFGGVTVGVILTVKNLKNAAASKKLTEAEANQYVMVEGLKSMMYMFNVAFQGSKTMPQNAKDALAETYHNFATFTTNFKAMTPEERWEAINEVSGSLFNQAMETVAASMPAVAEVINAAKSATDELLDELDKLEGE